MVSHKLDNIAAAELRRWGWNCRRPAARLTGLPHWRPAFGAANNNNDDPMTILGR